MNPNPDISPEEWDAIEGYLLQNLAPEERTEFERRLSADERLRTNVAEGRLLLLGVQEAELREKMKDFHQSPQAAQKEFRIGQRKTGFRTWLLAASLIFVLGVGGWLLLRKGGNDDLYAVYFKPDPGLMTTMGATDNYTFDRAMVDYKRGDYKTAIRSWDSLQKAQPANDTLNYFLGAAHLADGNAKAAIGYLQKVTVLPESFFTGDAWWYLGLALSKEGRRAEAIDAIEKSSHPEKAKLLRELKNE